MTATERRIASPLGRRTARRLTVATAFAALFTLIAAPAPAQIVTDGSVGEARVLTGGLVRIEDGLGRRSGGNLLHSFDRFSVETGQIAFFGVPGGVDTVIGRVTGGEASRLDGRVAFLDADFAVPAAADFWFFNPAGVLVGPNAQFPTGGALRFSGGDALIFADGATVSADLAEGLTLTAAAPEAFGFLGADPGPVTIRGAALPSEGAGIALSGGEVVIEEGVLFSEIGSGGDLVLVAGGRGDVAPVTAAGVAAAEARPTEGAIRLIGAEPGALRRDGPLRSGDGGDIVLSAGVVEAAGGVVLTETLFGAGGDLNITADRLVLADGAAFGTFTSNDFDAGAIRVVARDASLLRGAAIRSQTGGAGDAGSITVRDFETLRISRDGSSAATLIESAVGFDRSAADDEAPRGATGNAGLVRVLGGDLRLEDGGQIFSTTLGAGNAGAIRVRVDTLAALGGGQIGSGGVDADDRPGGTTGAGGDLLLVGRESLFFSGVQSDTATAPEPDPSGVFSGSEGRNSGDGGDLTIRAPLIVLTNEAEIGAETFFDASAGAVSLSGGVLRVEDGAELTTSSRRGGVAGALSVTMTEGVFVSGGVAGDALIASEALGAGGAAGSIAVAAPEIRVLDGGRITTASASSDGGSIALEARDLTLVDAGEVTTSVADDAGDGGAIRVEGGPLVLRDEARLASTAVFGDGGEVVIGAGFSLIEPGSAIDVSSVAGEAGVVRFLGVVGDQSSESQAPPAEFFNRFALIDDFCVAAVTGGSALRLEGPRAAPAGGARAPALFGDAIPYPQAGAAAGEARGAPIRPLALAADLAQDFTLRCGDPS